MFVAGIDGCSGGWIAFTVEVPSHKTSVQVVNLPLLLQKQPADLACVAIDIPIGLLDRSRACDKAARKLLGWPRRSSIFSPPCRMALLETTYENCCAVNYETIGKKISRQAWGIVPKIKQVDDVISPDHQRWVYEVHPEVSFWALAERRSMKNGKKTASGVTERLNLLRNIFPEAETYLYRRPQDVSKDDLLDAAVAAWTALRTHSGTASRVCECERDNRGMDAAIWY